MARLSVPSPRIFLVAEENAVQRALLQQALQRFAGENCAQKLINFAVMGGGVARVHYPIVTAAGEQVGEVISGRRPR